MIGARVDRLLVRLGKGHDVWALELPGIIPMILGDRRMPGWVRADASVYGDDALRQRLLTHAMTFVRTHPRKYASMLRHSARVISFEMTGVIERA